jgi:hypothetical protein
MCGLQPLRDGLDKLNLANSDFFRSLFRPLPWSGNPKPQNLPYFALSYDGTNGFPSTE